MCGGGRRVSLSLTSVDVMVNYLYDSRLDDGSSLRAAIYVRAAPHG